MTTNDVMTAAEAAALAGVEHGGLCHEDAARALRSVVALHEAVASRDRHAAWGMRQAFAFGVDGAKRAAALALRPVLPDAWERLRGAPDPEWPAVGVEPEAPDCAPYLAGWLAGAEAAREEAAETCDAWALLYHPTLRSTIATALAARIRALPPAAPSPPRAPAVRAPDEGGTGEGGPDAPDGAAGALAASAREVAVLRDQLRHARTRAARAEMEVDDLRAAVEGRTTPPTDAEIDAHDAAGGRWRCVVPDALRMSADGLHGHAARLHRETIAATGYERSQWWATDGTARPCAWPAPKAAP